MLIKRRLDWLRGNLTVLCFIMVGAITMPVTLWAVLDNGMPMIGFVLVLDAVFVASIISMIRTGEGCRYPYALTFQRWQDHELPDPRGIERVDRMIRYCVKHNIRFVADNFHGIPYRLRFLYEDDLHQANLAV